MISMAEFFYTINIMHTKKQKGGKSTRMRLHGLLSKLKPGKKPQVGLSEKELKYTTEKFYNISQAELIKRDKVINKLSKFLKEQGRNKVTDINDDKFNYAEGLKRYFNKSFFDKKDTVKKQEFSDLYMSFFSNRSNSDKFKNLRKKWKSKIENIPKERAQKSRTNIKLNQLNNNIRARKHHLVNYNIKNNNVKHTVSRKREILKNTLRDYESYLKSLNLHAKETNKKLTNKNKRRKNKVASNLFKNSNKLKHQHKNEILNKYYEYLGKYDKVSKLINNKYKSKKAPRKIRNYQTFRGRIAKAINNQVESPVQSDIINVFNNEINENMEDTQREHYHTGNNIYPQELEAIPPSSEHNNDEINPIFSNNSINENWNGNGNNIIESTPLMNQEVNEFNWIKQNTSEGISLPKDININASLPQSETKVEENIQQTNPIPYNETRVKKKIDALEMLKRSRMIKEHQNQEKRLVKKQQLPRLPLQISEQIKAKKNKKSSNDKSENIEIQENKSSKSKTSSKPKPSSKSEPSSEPENIYTKRIRNRRLVMGNSSGNLSSFSNSNNGSNSEVNLPNTNVNSETNNNNPRIKGVPQKLKLGLGNKSLFQKSTLTNPRKSVLTSKKGVRFNPKKNPEFVKKTQRPRLGLFESAAANSVNV